jgi:hypothetical protein
VQKIIKDVKAKFDVDIEIQIRPGNPASLKYYKDGTGVPKPEWIKPKASEWMDVVLGAPDSTLGRATIYPPRKPSAAELARYSRAEQLQITQRYAKQVELFDDATKPGGKMYQLLQDSKRAEGATVTTGFGTNAKQIKVRYSLEPVGDSGAFLIKDELAGGKYVLSDADIQAAIKASTGKHIPAAEGRGAIERYVMERFEKDLVSFGRHGWSHSGVDLAAKWSKSWLEFNMGSMSVGDARAMAQWFLTGKHDWVDALAKQLGRPVTADDLLALFRPGSFVVKFNGTNMRVGYAAGIR